jgi:hypothetical protein
MGSSGLTGCQRTPEVLTGSGGEGLRRRLGCFSISRFDEGVATESLFGLFSLASLKTKVPRPANPGRLYSIKLCHRRLDNAIEICDSEGAMSPLSTAEVARKVGIDKATLERWLASGKITRPKSLRVGRKLFRNWTDVDVKMVRQHKQKNYRKGRGRKPKPKR